MIGDSLTDAFGKDLNKSFGSMPGSMNKKTAGTFASVAKAAGIDSRLDLTLVNLMMQQL